METFFELGIRGALIVNKSLGTLKRTVIKYDTCCVSARSEDDSVSPADIDREFCHARLDARPPPCVRRNHFSQFIISCLFH